MARCLMVVVKCPNLFLLMTKEIYQNLFTCASVENSLLAIFRVIRYHNTMQVTFDMVRHMASLSRLNLTDEEVTRFTQQLSAIVSYASHLPEVSGHAEPSALRLDEDEVRVEEFDGALLLRNAIELENGYVKVPAILDRSES